MIGKTLLIGLALLFPGASVSQSSSFEPDGFADAAQLQQGLPSSRQDVFFQVVIERQLIVRIPARPSSLNNFAAADSGTAQQRQKQTPIVWRETKAPKCVAMRSVVGIQSVQRESIDLITRENQRLRAMLNRGCRALDFYSGFYVKPSKDGRLCADRDPLHARSGAECEIAKFRLMVPVRQES